MFPFRREKGQNVSHPTARRQFYLHVHPKLTDHDFKNNHKRETSLRVPKVTVDCALYMFGLENSCSTKTRRNLISRVFTHWFMQFGNI